MSRGLRTSPLPGTHASVGDCRQNSRCGHLHLARSNTVSATRGVGTVRLARRQVSPSPSPNRTCAFPCIRLSRDRPSAAGLPPLGHPVSISPACRPTLPGEPSGYLSSPGASIPCRPSPWGRLSRPPTTMAAPTAVAGIGRLPALPSRHRSLLFLPVDSARSFRRQFPLVPIRSSRDPERQRGRSG